MVQHRKTREMAGNALEELSPSLDEVSQEGMRTVRAPSEESKALGINWQIHESYPSVSQRFLYNTVVINNPCRWTNSKSLHLALLLY